jgi:hypothetical protein
MKHPNISLPFEKRDGKVHIDRGLFAQRLQQLRDGAYEVVVTRYVANRSLRQNAFYHAVVVEILADYWGLDHDEAHELIKQHCNSKVVEVVNKETGEVEEHTIAASTASLDKEQWAQFIERCQRWAAEQFDVVIPDPDPEYMFNRKNTAA